MACVAWIDEIWLVFKVGTNKLALKEAYLEESDARYHANNVNGLYGKAEIRSVPFRTMSD